MTSLLITLLITTLHYFTFIIVYLKIRCIFTVLKRYKINKDLNNTISSIIVSNLGRPTNHMNRETFKAVPQ